MSRWFPCTPEPPSRRAALRSLVGGSSLLYSGVVSSLLGAGSARGDPSGPLAPRQPHFPARAKRMIFLYMTGGVSHLDTFDPKPKLQREGDRPGNAKGARYLAPHWDFHPGGSAGTLVSDLFPNVRRRMDDICLIRSMHGDHGDHFQATLGIHTGSVSFARPSIGSWVSYGLGTENQNLPSFVVLAPKLPYAGTQVFASDFLPGVHTGTRVSPGEEPVRDLNRRASTARLQELELSLLRQRNLEHLLGREGDASLEPRLRSFETAFGMQMAMPEALDFSRESDATLSLYGLTRGQTQGFAWQCLAARRLAERGVRFIELVDTGASNNWDAHGDIRGHEPLARQVDRPIYGLLTDLQQRGLLEDTLVVWTTEFGRTPTKDGPDGRGHYHPAFSSWLAGGGVRGGHVHGVTDDVGGKVVQDPVHVHDFHATILHCLGFDHTRLTYRHAGRDFRLTDVAGRVVPELLA
jgi:hypothetical protein